MIMSTRRSKIMRESMLVVEDSTASDAEAFVAFDAERVSSLASFYSSIVNKVKHPKLTTYVGVVALTDYLREWPIKPLQGKQCLR